LIVVVVVAIGRGEIKRWAWIAPWQEIFDSAWQAPF
jgi:hypothetical protein